LLENVRSLKQDPFFLLNLKMTTELQRQLPILVYSSQVRDENSKEILTVIQALNKQQMFQYCCLEQVGPRGVPPGITRVPSVLIPTTGQILVGKPQILQFLARPVDTRVSIVGANNPNNIPPGIMPNQGVQDKELEASNLNDEGGVGFDDVQNVDLPGMVMPSLPSQVAMRPSPTIAGPGPGIGVEQSSTYMTSKIPKNDFDARLKAYQEDLNQYKGPEVQRY
jgi:hypothetical protein